MKRQGVFGLMVLVFAVVFGFVLFGCDTGGGGGTGGYVPPQQEPQWETTKFEGKWEEKNVPRNAGGEYGVITSNIYTFTGNNVVEEVVFTNQPYKAFFKGTFTFTATTITFTTTHVSTDGNNWQSKSQTSGPFDYTLSGDTFTLAGVEFTQQITTQPTKFEGEWEDQHVPYDDEYGFSILSDIYTFTGNSVSRVLEQDFFLETINWVYRGTFTFTDTIIKIIYTQHSTDGITWEPSNYTVRRSYTLSGDTLIMGDIEFTKQP